MTRERQRRAIGPFMVALGLFQAWLGLSGGEWIYAALGGLYALLGVAMYWTTRRELDD